MNERTPSGAIRFCAHIVVDIQTALSYPDDMELWLKAVARHRPLAWSGGSLWLRPFLRLILRPLLRPSLHGKFGPGRRKCRSQHGLRTYGFADISTQRPGRNTTCIQVAPIVLVVSFLAPLALGACAIASAPAPQRSLAPSAAPIALGATAIASALATQRPPASALASQRLASERPRAWGLA